MISIFVDNKQIDVTEDIDLLITRSIADIREPEKRTSDWSKTVTLPETKVNNTLFTYIFDVALDILGNGQFAPSFNPNKKADVVVLNDGLEQLRGFIRLIQINVLDKNLIEYECSLHGQTSDLFTSLGNAKLSELDFSEYNHNLDQTNVANSWDTSIIKNGISQPFSYGNGYVYAQILSRRSNNTDVTNSWKVDDHIVSLYAKTVIDKIFSNVGYQYTDDSIFNTDRFKRLIIPYNNFGLNVDETAVTNRLFQAQISAPLTANKGDVIPFNNDSTGGNFDNGGNYNVSTYSFTAPVAGRYNFFLSLDASATFLTSSSLTSATVEFHLYVNNVKTRIILVNSDNSYSSIGTNTFNFTTIGSKDVDLNKNDVVKLVYYDVIENVFQTGTSWSTTYKNISLNINPSTYFYNQASADEYGFNNIIEFSKFFSSDYTQKELLLSFVKMFNLYIEPDYNNPKKLKFIPRDDFYNGQNKDWSKKLDYSQTTEIIPMGELDSNPYIFTYKEGNDNNNKTYKDNTGRIYGDRIIRIDNDFVKQEKKIEIVFAPSPIYKDDTTGRYYSKYSNGADNNSQLHLLYYSGAVTTPIYTIYNIDYTSAIAYNKYPVTLHIDSISNMQFDLGFGMPTYLNVGSGLNYSNQNLVNVYWYKTIIELTNKNSKIFRGYFRINAYDWNSLRFNDLYYFENQYWRLNKVIDYNPLQEGVYQCEFLLAKYYEGTSAIKKNLGTGVSDYFGNGFPFGRPLGFTGVRSGGVNLGMGTDLGGEIINVGDNTNSMGLRLNTNLGGSNNTIPSTFSNVNLLSCNDFIPLEQSKTYIENWTMLGAYLSGGNVVEIDDTDSPYTLLREDYLIVADTNNGDINMVLPNPSTNKGKTFVVKKIDSNHKIYITAGDGSILIDDTTTHEMGNSKLCHHFISTGSKYYVIVP